MTEEQYQNIIKSQEEQFQIIKNKVAQDKTGALTFIWELAEFYFQRNLLMKEQERRKAIL